MWDFDVNYSRSDAEETATGVFLERQDECLALDLDLFRAQGVFIDLGFGLSVAGSLASIVSLSAMSTAVA